jgi:hypothetical protein
VSRRATPPHAGEHACSCPTSIGSRWSRSVEVPPAELCCNAVTLEHTIDFKLEEAVIDVFDVPERILATAPAISMGTVGELPAPNSLVHEREVY